MLSDEDVKSIFKLSDKDLKKMIRTKNTIPFIKIGGARRYLKTDVIEFIKENYAV